MVGGPEENEILLYNVILAIRDSLHLIFKYVSVFFILTNYSLSLPVLLIPPPHLHPSRSIYKQSTRERMEDRSANKCENRQSVDRRTIIENYDLVSLAIDEIVDSGIVMETDPTIIVHRCSRAPTQDVNIRNIDPFSEQGVNNLAQLGRTKLADWLRQGL